MVYKHLLKEIKVQYLVFHDYIIEFGSKADILRLKELALKAKQYELASLFHEEIKRRNGEV